MLSNAPEIDAARPDAGLVSLQQDHRMTFARDVQRDCAADDAAAYHNDVGTDRWVQRASPASASIGTGFTGG
jgi:hypothetical protein